METNLVDGNTENSQEQFLPRLEPRAWPENSTQKEPRLLSHKKNGGHLTKHFLCVSHPPKYFAKMGFVLVLL